MSNYGPVKDALESGADPAMLCATCPWDRFCITPPSMTSGEIKRQIDEALEKDKQDAAKKEAAGEAAGMPVGLLLATVLNSGRDIQSTVCPVVAMRMRSSDGAAIASALRRQMLAWDDNKVTP